MLCLRAAPLRSAAQTVFSHTTDPKRPLSSVRFWNGRATCYCLAARASPQAREKVWARGRGPAWSAGPSSHR